MRWQGSANGRGRGNTGLSGWRHTDQRQGRNGRGRGPDLLGESLPRGRRSEEWYSAL